MPAPGAGPLTPAQIVARLQGQGATQGWDVVLAMTAGKVNELFQRQFVLGLVDHDDLPPVSGTVPVIGGYSVEFVDVILGDPLIAFDPATDPQEALLTIPVLSGLVHTVMTAGGVATVVATQWIAAADGYTVTGQVPLAEVGGDLEHKTEVVLQIAAGRNFVASLHTSGATGTVLGRYFLSFLAAHATGYRYRLGTLLYKDNGTDLVPVKGFKIATQRDEADPDDLGRVLLFVPTAYNPGGGSQTALPLADIVPAGTDVALLLSSRVVFADILAKAVSPVFGGALASAANATGAWSVAVTGGAVDAGRASFSQGLLNYGSGDCLGRSADMVVGLAGITFASSAGQITASWHCAWSQPWHTAAQAGEGGCEAKSPIPMSVSLRTTYRTSVDPLTGVISFAADNTITPDFPYHTDWFGNADGKTRVAQQISGNLTRRLAAIFSFSLPQIGAFAVANLLFPQQQATRLTSVHVPGDLVAFGSLEASGLAVSPALATITTAGRQPFTANGPVTWSASAGTIDADGAYTPPARLARSQVVVITATAAGDGPPDHAYAAVVVTPARVNVAPVIAVFQQGDAPQAFAASLPGSAAQPAWTLSPPIGEIDALGVYTPPADLGAPVAVTATAQIADASGQAQIVVFPSRPAAVQVTPNATAPLAPGASAAFTARMNGKAADVAWSVLPPIGVIDADGVYTAPARIDAPSAALIVAASPDNPALGGTAVVLLSPAADWSGSAVARPTGTEPR